MGHLEMGVDIIRYQNCAGHKREKNGGLNNIFVSLKRNSTKFCMLIENNKKIISLSASLL